MRVIIDIHFIGIYTPLLVFTILADPIIFRNTWESRCCTGLKAKGGVVFGIGKQRFWSLEVQRWIVTDW